MINSFHSSGNFSFFQIEVISLWISPQIVSPPVLISSAGISSIPGDLWLFNLPIANSTSKGFQKFYWRFIAVLRKLMAPDAWAIASRPFGGTYPCRLRGFEWIPGLKTLEDKGGTFLRNVSKKLPNHTTQKLRRPTSSTVTLLKVQTTAFVLWRIHLFISYNYFFPFIVFVDALWRYCLVLSAGTKNCKNVDVFTQNRGLAIQVPHDSGDSTVV